MIQIIKKYKTTIVLLALSLLCVYDLSQSDSPDDIGLVFPKIIVGLLVLTTLLLGLTTFIKSRGRGKQETTKAEFKMPWAILGSMVGYILLLNVFGFFVLTPFFVFSSAKLFGVKTKSSIILAISLTLIIYLLFVQVLFVPFPSGISIFKRLNEMILY